MPFFFMTHAYNNPVALVYDDHVLFAESFAAVLERLAFFSSVQTFEQEHPLRRFLLKHGNEPVYVFLDYYLPQKNALSLIKDIRRMNKKARIIVTSSVSDPILIRHILTYEPNGFISKTSGVENVVACLNTIEQHETYICPIVQHILDIHGNSGPVITFTAREMEILQYFARGLSIVETAEATNLSKHTIVSHRRNMMSKSGAKSIVELLSYAYTNHLI